jgi:murein DD-endopeptidase MepM/ murein hydrolase activator NlpD
VTVKDDGATGYGKYVVIESENRRSLLAHCSEILVANSFFAHQGVPVAKSGSTGSSSGPHLHWTFKLMKNGVVLNKANGFDGAMDCSAATALWTPQNLHTHATYTENAAAYLAMTFKPDQVIA